MDAVEGERGAQDQGEQEAVQQAVGRQPAESEGLGNHGVEHDDERQGRRQIGEPEAGA